MPIRSSASMTRKALAGYPYGSAEPFVIVNWQGKGIRCSPEPWRHADLSVQTGAGERIGDLPPSRKLLESRLQRLIARQAGRAHALEILLDKR